MFPKRAIPQNNPISKNNHQSGHQEPTFEGQILDLHVLKNNGLVLPMKAGRLVVGYYCQTRGWVLLQ
jgi:hypothetical protein